MRLACLSGGQVADLIKVPVEAIRLAMRPEATDGFLDFASPQSTAQSNGLKYECGRSVRPPATHCVDASALVCQQLLGPKRGLGMVT